MTGSPKYFTIWRTGAGPTPTMRAVPFRTGLGAGLSILAGLVAIALALVILVPLALLSLFAVGGWLAKTKLSRMFGRLRWPLDRHGRRNVRVIER